jgi:ribokinase
LLEIAEMNKILVIGSLNIDLVVRAPRFPAPGETIQGEDLVTFPGGKGANQAVAAARLGGRVVMLGRVGVDAFGAALIENLEKNRVEVGGVIRDETSPTGTAVIVVDSHGQNSIVLSPGANARVSAADIGPEAFADSSLTLLQFEIPMETVSHAAALARAKGQCILVNPAPARALPDELLTAADFILPNETELGLLTGRPVGDLASIEEASRSLIVRGAKNIIVTLGANGALTVNKDGAKHIPAYKVEVVDTTAAGDAFIGGLAVRLSNGKSLEDAVQYACACGALATTKFGAQPSLPTIEDVERLLRQH